MLFTVIIYSRSILEWGIYGFCCLFYFEPAVKSLKVTVFVVPVLGQNSEPTVAHDPAVYLFILSQWTVPSSSFLPYVFFKTRKTKLSVVYRSVDRNVFSRVARVNCLHGLLLHFLLHIKFKSNVKAPTIAQNNFANSRRCHHVSRLTSTLSRPRGLPTGLLMTYISDLCAWAFILQTQGIRIQFISTFERHPCGVWKIKIFVLMGFAFISIFMVLTTWCRWIQTYLWAALSYTL